MKGVYMLIISILLFADCSAVQTRKNTGWNTNSYDYELKKYPGGRKRKSEYDIDSTYTEWHKNGLIKFRESRKTGMTGVFSWCPKTGRIVRDKEVKLRFKYDEICEKKIRWGEYYRYEGWYFSGRKKFVYDCKNERYIEWGEHRGILSRGR